MNGTPLQDPEIGRLAERVLTDYSGVTIRGADDLAADLDALAQQQVPARLREHVEDPRVQAYLEDLHSLLRACTPPKTAGEIQDGAYIEDGDGAGGPPHPAVPQGDPPEREDRPPHPVLSASATQLLSDLRERLVPDLVLPRDVEALLVPLFPKTGASQEQLILAVRILAPMMFRAGIRSIQIVPHLFDPRTGETHALNLDDPDDIETVSRMLDHGISS